MNSRKVAIIQLRCNLIPILLISNKCSNLWMIFSTKISRSKTIWKRSLNRILQRSKNTLRCLTISKNRIIWKSWSLHLKRNRVSVPKWFRIKLLLKSRKNQVCLTTESHPNSFELKKYLVIWWQPRQNLSSRFDYIAADLSYPILY